MSLSWLHDAICMEKTASFNTEQDHGAEEVLRPFCEREDISKYLESSDDDQVLLCISFKELVSLRSVGIVCMGPNSPKTIRIFANQAIADFDEAETSEASAVLRLEEGDGRLKMVEISDVGNELLFKNIREMTIFVQESHGGDKSVITWLGLMGEQSGTKLGVVQDASYELRPLDGFQTRQVAGPRFTTGF